MVGLTRRGSARELTSKQILVLVLEPSATSYMPSDDELLLCSILRRDNNRWALLGAIGFMPLSGLRISGFGFGDLFYWFILLAGALAMVGVKIKGSF